MISTDRKVFEENSPVRQRMVEYGGLVEELHIVVFSKRKSEIRNLKSEKIQISKNVFAYPSDSFSRWFYILDAIRISKKIITNHYTLTPVPWLITAQDPFETAFVGWRIARAFGTKLQIQVHTDFLSPYFAQKSILNKIRVLVAKFLLPRADCIRVVSERISNSLKAKRYKLKTVPNILPIFIDAEKIKNMKPSFDLREKYPQFDRVILMASRLSKEKNIELAIDAMSEVLSTKRLTLNPLLLIVGSGPEEERLKLKAKSCKLAANVVFEGWQSDTVSYYKTADLFLNTSNYEGYGLSLVEAAVSGCPIVTTDVGVAPELKKGGAKISICPVGDKACVIENIFTALSNPKSVNLPWTRPATLIESNKNEYLKKHTALWQKCLNLLR